MPQQALWTPYCGAGPVPGDLASRWNLDPWLLAMLALIAALPWIRAAGVERRGLWLAGVGALAVSFVSPLCALSSALFSARVVHHMLLIAAAAPLLAWAAPREAGGRLGGPLAWTFIHGLILWAWHVPSAAPPKSQNRGSPATLGFFAQNVIFSISTSPAPNLPPASGCHV